MTHKKTKIYIELAEGSTLTGLGLIGSKFKLWLFYRLYEMHLMEMVVAEDPIKYLGDNI